MHPLGSYLVWNDLARERGDTARARRHGRWLADDAVPFHGPDALERRAGIRARVTAAVVRLGRRSAARAAGAAMDVGVDAGRP